jgi:hypothetical protein
VGKPEGRSPLGRPRCRWVDSIKMDLSEVVGRLRCRWVDNIKMDLSEVVFVLLSINVTHPLLIFY